MHRTDQPINHHTGLVTGLFKQYLSKIRCAVKQKISRANVKFKKRMNTIKLFRLS